MSSTSAAENAAQVARRALSDTDPVVASPVVATPVQSLRSVAPAAVRSILLVDDIAMNRDVLGEFLRSVGYRVLLEASGEAAVHRAAQEPLDLILMDVRMPEMDGLEATRRIRALPAPHCLVPVLALTAFAFPEQVAQCKLAGMDGHIAKPVDFDTLKATIDDTIAGVPPNWGETGPLISEFQDEDAVPPRLDRAVLDKTLAYLPADEVVTNLQLLRVRNEQLVRLLDQPAGLTLLIDAAHALGSAAGMFGFVALSRLARSFERAATLELPELAHLGEALRAETCAALAALDALLLDNRTAPDVIVPAAGDAVIVVENDPLIRGIIRAVLRYARQQVFLAADGLEAVTLATQLEARLVLLDIDMPRLNGLLACEAIRALPGYADVPIVMLTGYTDERMYSAAQRVGATDFITKPFRPDVLLVRLKAYLDTPVEALHGVFLEVPALDQLPQAVAADDDCLRGGWVKLEPAPADAAPNRQRHSQEGDLLAAGIPPTLVKKWLGYAPLSSATISDTGMQSPGFLD